jgi:hypothetical protein
MHQQHFKTLWTAIARSVKVLGVAGRSLETVVKDAVMEVDFAASDTAGC